MEFRAAKTLNRGSNSLETEAQRNETDYLVFLLNDEPDLNMWMSRA